MMAFFLLLYSCNEYISCLIIPTLLDPPSMHCVHGTCKCNVSNYHCCEMHVSHAFHMHEPGTDVRIWTCDVWWAAHIGAAHICNIVWCICLPNNSLLAICMLEQGCDISK